MDFALHTNRRLAEEHSAVIDLLRRVEDRLTGRAGAYPPPAGDESWGPLARTLVAGVEGEVAAHFAFEEEKLFPLLHESGEGDLAMLLLEEHGTVREAAAPVLELARRSLAGPLADDEWQRLRTHGLELCERLTSHAQKEDLSLLPVLEGLLDADADRTLFEGYALA
jgi:hypothetical protein